MDKRRNNQLTKYILRVGLMLVFLAGLLMGCAGRTSEDGPTTYFHSSLDQQDAVPGTEETADSEEIEWQERGELYLIVENNQIEESLRLYRYENGMEYRYYYGSGTRFHDKYGNRSTGVHFTVGAVITLGNVDAEGILREARLSDAVWTYDDVTRFQVDEKRHIFEIAGSRYNYEDNETYVFSNDERVDIDQIKKGDTLSVVGIGRKILSICVTTGQGILMLANTELFEGSFLQLGTRFFVEITRDMQLPVEEGTYNLVVANKGWGGNREVTIQRGETTVVDLDELKGEGPKSGRIQFVVDVADAVLTIDGEAMDYSEPVELTYGVHALGVYATGYDKWERNLFVNSKEATIVIDLEDTEASETVNTSEEKDDSQNKGGQSSEQNDSKGSTSHGSTREEREAEIELIKDLLTNSVF